MSYHTIKQVAKNLRNGSHTVQQLCSTCLHRLNYTSELNSFITSIPEAARHEAREAQTRINNGSKSVWEGITIAVKDNFSTAGTQTTCASRMLQGYIPPYNATVVQRLLDRGAVLVGKTNLDEFAMGCGSVDGAFGPVRNPWKYKFKKSNDVQSHLGLGVSGKSDVKMAGARWLSSHMAAKIDEIDWHIAGGSSGGSAVAVATGAAFAAIGSDTGGSTRNPAAYCGVVGLKPTYGLLSRHGLISLVNSMDVPGLLTRCVDDAATMLNALAGHDPLDSTTVGDEFQPIDLDKIDSMAELRQICIGLPKEYHAPGTSAETINAWQRLADMLSDAGAKMVSSRSVHCELSDIGEIIVKDFSTGLRAGDESSTEALYAATRHEGFNDVVRGRILAGNYFLLKKNYEKYYLQAQKVRRLISNDFRRVFSSGVDVLLTPTVLGDAPLYSWFSQADNRTRTQEQDIYTQAANMAGIPAINVPVTLSSNGLPIGLQLMSKSFAERQLLTVAKAVELLVDFEPLNLNYLDM